MGHCILGQRRLGLVLTRLDCLAYYKQKQTLCLPLYNSFPNFGPFPPHASQFWAKQAPNIRGPVAQSPAFPQGAYVFFGQCLGTWLRARHPSLPILSSAEAYGGNLSNQ